MRHSSRAAHAPVAYNGTTMELREALLFEALRKASVVAGSAGLGRAVRWVHVVDLPDPAAWVQPGMLLLTTGYAWPRSEEEQRVLTRALAERQIAAVGLAVPQFFEHFPAPMRDEAERAGLPLVEIPWEVPFAQIAEELLQALVVDQYRQLERLEATHRALTRAAVEAESLQDIATALGTLLDRAVTIEDADGKLLAAHRDPALEDDLRRATVELGCTPPAYEAALEQLGLARTIAAAAGSLRIPALPALGATGRVVCPIMLKRELVGRAWIIEGARPLSDTDLRAAEQAAMIAALHMLHQRELEVREARVGYAFLDSLLAGDFALTPQAAERALLLGFDPAGSYCVGLLVLHTGLPLAGEGFQRRERLAAALRLRLQAAGGPSLLALSANQIPFLLPAGADPAPLWAALAAPDLSLALSRACAGVEGLRRGYRELQAVVHLLRPGEFQRAEGLLLPRILAGDAAARAEFIDELLGPLRGARHGDDLVASLIAFARHGFRLARAAEALFIHPKTLAYRLGRIAALTGLDLDDPETRFRVQLAARIIALEE
ncbi:MAG: PucR family transcriptional regulator [Chloroflexales bacterium]|nr:PucR family transcriptional regulator [Chloroflexales bacterium]